MSGAGKWQRAMWLSSVTLTILVVGFQHRTEAERFLKEFRERLAKFGLELHADKTGLIEFERFAARNRKLRGEGKPETFTFLGFTHYCGQRHKS
jgi:RNA-directed DNA polymerase